MQESIIFQGKDVSVVFANFNSPHVFVTFTNFNENGHKRGFAQDMLQEAGISGLYFISHWNHWWQTPEMLMAIEVVKKKCLLKGRQSIGYGSSMGAYAAIMFSQILELTSVLALSPQFSVDPTKTGFDPRWAPYYPKINFIMDDATRQISTSSQIALVYDPFDIDGKHAQLYPKYNNIHRYPVPFGGHPVSHYLRDAKMLKQLVLDFPSEFINRNRFRQETRCARRSNPIYFLSICRTSLQKHHPAICIHMAKHAIGLFPEDARPWNFLSLAHEAQGDVVSALASAQQSAILPMANPNIQKRIDRLRTMLTDCNTPFSGQVLENG